MPLPQDDTLPKGNQPAGSTSKTVDGADTEELIEKIQKLGGQSSTEQGEEGEDDEEEEGEGEGDGEQSKVGAVGEGGDGNSDKKKKKKKKKGKTAKAVDRLKLVAAEYDKEG